MYVVIECSFRYTHHLADFFDRQLFLVIEGHCQLPFVFIQRFGSAAAAAPGSGCSQSSLGALFDEIALKLGKGSKDMECKLAILRIRAITHTNKIPSLILRHP